MRKLKKIFVSAILIITIFAVFVMQKTFANDIKNSIKSVDYSDEYLKWQQLPEEERNKMLMPRMYDVIKTTKTLKNPILKANLLGASLEEKYSLKDVIPDNLEIKNQQNTNSCWTFATLSSLETNLAMFDYKKGIEERNIYDYSERHMEYATSRIFANGEENKIGYNRKVGTGGNYYLAKSYLTNGSGAILENEMPFENNEDIIDISEIQNKTISSQVYDTVDFPNYINESGQKDTEIMNQIKQHIKNYGSVYASLHGSLASATGYTCYNNENGAKFCNDISVHKPDHAVSIIGWDDNYSIDNFAEGVRPKEKGAWIVRNSWGEKLEYKLDEFKEMIFAQYEEQCIAQGWTEPSLIPNDFIEENGYTIEGDIAYMKIGDNGLFYVSYEDCNISTTLFGIEKAKNEVDYENIYQYDYYYPNYAIEVNTSQILLANTFKRATSNPEYLTQVAIYAPETYTCKVYVNPNGTDKTESNLQLVQLKGGESETIGTGYHTLEFLEPVKLEGENYTVVIEIQGKRESDIYISIETNEDKSLTWWEPVTVEQGKCFFTTLKDIEDSEWIDLGKISELYSVYNGDSTIKAFTVSNIVDDSLKDIEITTPPTKTKYFEGENFDSTGMVVKANYNNNTSTILDSASYNITDGTNLKVGQTSVTITYEDKSVSQPITVEKNTVTELIIKTPPKKTEYKEGENFDKTGMVIEATYKDGTTKEVTDYIIENGNNVKANQTSITISYEGKTAEQPITVIPNPLVEIKITKEPNKTTYVVGQDFDKTGMIVTGTFEDKSEQEILDYTIENGTDLKKGQTSVTITYEGKSVTQTITVEEKSILSIAIDKKPTKLTYIQNKEELDLNGGSIKVIYNDETYEIIEMTSNDVKVEGFDNSKLGKVTLTVSYQSKTAQFEIEIIEEEKAENSNFENIACKVEKVKAYYFTDESKKDYTLIDVVLNNIKRNMDNDKLEYYYYLSTNAKEEEISDWIKITEEQGKEDKLQFTIDSRNVKNYDEIASEEVVYLYVKEVAIKGGNQSIEITKAMNLQTDENVEIYVDNAKKEDVQNGNTDKDNNSDNTIMNGKLPHTGKITIVIIVTIILGLGTFFYIRYKNLSKYVK